uniref:Uncharacterized protein n=1 Tax=Lygus hesperus TaxID=30085 RepID=A0A0K8T6P2_LYGHE
MGNWRDILAAIQDLTKGTKVIPGDVFRAFNLLLNDRDREAAENITDILDGFKPSSPLEKLLRTKLVDRYKVSTEAWALLLSNDSLYVNQALKFDWFFSRNEDAEDFMMNILPKLSYSTRLKILNRYGSHLKDTGAGKAIYAGVKSRYGINNAALILPACSESFVQHEIGKFTTTLPRIVVMALIDKYPTLSARYIEELVDEKTSRKHKIVNHYCCAFIKLSHHDLSAFVNLLEKHGKQFPAFRLGNRQMKKLLKTHFDKFQHDFRTMIIPFHERQVFRRLSLDQFKNIYISSLLSSRPNELFENYRWELPFTSLEYLKPSVRPLVFTSAFKIKYNRDCTADDLLLKFPSLWLANLPGEARVKWVDAKIEGMNEVREQAECISYLPVEHSVPRLKNLLASSLDGDTRTEIIRCLIKSVKINGCPKDLKDVIAYLTKKYQNENSQCKRTLLREISDLDEKVLLKLDLEDWVPILEFINSFIHIDDVWSYKWYLLFIFGKLTHSCFLKNADVDPYLRKYIELTRLCNNGVLTGSVIDIGRKTAFKKNYIEWFIREIPNIESKSYDDYFVVQLLESISNYNCTTKQSRIEIPDWLLEDLQRIVESPNSHFIGSIVKILEANKDVQLSDRLLDIWFPSYSSCEVLCRLLKRNPEKVLSNADILVPNMVNDKFRSYSYFYRKCRLYEQYGIPSKIISNCLLTLERKSPEEMGVPEFRNQLNTKSHAVQTLGILQDSSTYLKLCSEHSPSKQKIEENSKEIQIEYGVQRGICKSLTHVSSPLDTLPLLPKFTGGDYLKVVCGSLVGVCVRIPENVILPILEQWVDCPVSLRKHVLRLISNIAPIDTSIATFQKMFRTEKNTSLRLVLFIQVRNTFIAEPTEDSYKTFASIVHQLTEDDKEILDKLFDMNNVHEAYISRYVELVWQLIDSKWKNVLPKGKKTMIKSIDKHVFKFLSDSVCDTILEYELSSNLPNTPPSNFICYYLMCCSDKIRRGRLETVMAALGDAIKTHWNDLNRSGSGYAFPIRHVVSDIVESLCIESKDAEEPAKASLLLSDMKNSLLEYVGMADVLKESIWLDVYSLYLSQKGETNFASRLADLYNNYIQQTLE